MFLSIVAHCLVNNFDPLVWLKVTTKSQYHFYMETQTALAIPDEDDCITVYTASQALDCLQQVIAGCLSIPSHNVRVITRRLGGAFGGKAFRNMQV